MDYEAFIAEVKKYWDLRSKGLKKQGNRFLFQFTEKFKREVPEGEADEILFQFCREYIDEQKFPGDHLPRRHLPFQLTELLNSYFNRECAKNKMPQMRWAFQIFGEYYNPHETGEEDKPYHILERAYAHEKCDQQTVDLFFNAQVGTLWWGQHHFPEGCLITREEFESTQKTADRILLEKPVDVGLVEEYQYYVKLYQSYFEWEETGRTGDFCQLCRERGMEFEALPAFYYNGRG